MSTLLVLTTGQTDVQLVEGEARRELDKRGCAALHDEIEQRTGEWQLVDSPPSKAEGAANSLPQGAFVLCTPKLDAVLRYLKERAMEPDAVLILGTRRETVAQPGDPRFAGEILESRLRERGVTDVLRRPFLVDGERLEGEKDSRDAIIRREVVDRIDHAVRDRLQTITPAKIVFATTGGIPPVNTLVEEVVRLYAPPGSEIDPLEVADGAKADPPTSDQAISRRSFPGPAASYQARRHALELIEKGDFLGAWGAVQHLHDDEVERRWTRVVKWLAHFAASLPIPDDCDIDLLKHPRRAVRSGVRVELALRAGDIPRAVHGTVAFFESALWDHLDPRLTRHDVKRRWFKVDPPPTADLVRTSEENKVNHGRPFEVAREIDGEHWYMVFDDDVCAIRLAKRYLARQALATLAQAISPVRELRNDVAHNEPTPELMNEARHRMVEAQLWAPDDAFLAQPLVQNVLRDLGENDPSRLCTDLIATVRARLLGAAEEFPSAAPTSRPRVTL